MKLYLFITLFLTATISQSDNAKLKQDTHKDYTLIFEDDFSVLNFSKWQHEITMDGGGNREFEYYTNNRSNSFVRDGVLYLKPTFTSDIIGLRAVEKGGTMDIWGADPGTYCTSQKSDGCFKQSDGVNIINPITSARIRTTNSFSFKYGRIEVRAMLPEGDWIWPGIWLRPIHNEYGNWPASGEIDIVESRGNSPSYPPGGYNKFGTTLHWGPFPGNDPWSKSHAVWTASTEKDLIENFHTYGFIWNETYMGSYIDDEKNVVLSLPIDMPFWDLGGWYKNPNLVNPWIGGGKNAPFDKEFYMLLNVAVGGACEYFPDGNGKPWTNKDKLAQKQFWDSRDSWHDSWLGDNTAMRIDWVKVWGKK
ncbi:Beta-1,3-glucan-binding protein-like [Oopsacas minuta]|uniref:Beta-1,3-glucan-binding protein-like n=1 Tax=Oopsacas minuta TaxID=111878 RepID=A0AAV7K0G8_9METZ|nr:Beta-1,3-glucan-binding protein-like [Oopsacas minuta]